MKRLLFIFMLIQGVAVAQSLPGIDTARYMSKPVPTTIRTDTLANNLVTYNQTTHVANLMSGTTLKSYFQNGLLTKTNYTTLSNRIAADSLARVTYTAGNGISISGGVISVVQPTISYPTRTVNTAFTISTTKAALVFYTITTSATNPLLSGSSTATATLQYSTNGGTSYQNATQLSNLSSVALAVTVQLTNAQTVVLSSVIPANALVKITTATTGTASVTINSSQEITY